MAKEEKVTFLQASIETLVDTPLLPEDVEECKSELTLTLERN